ncbi:uncharacterized protein LOC110082816 isoform X1 [Pogona vitticeps]
MEAPQGVARQVEDLQRHLHLLAGLLLPALVLLCLLSCLVLLRWRPARGRVPAARGLGWAPSASPQLLQGVPGGAGRRALAKPLQPPGPARTGLSGRPHPSSSSSGGGGGGGGGRAMPGWGSRRHPPRPKLGFCSPASASGQPRQGARQETPAAATATASTTPSSELEKQERGWAPPNSPATSSSGTGGAPGGGFPGYLTSTQDKIRSGGRSTPAVHAHSVPFEYGSSIRRAESRVKLNSANFTASQGPGLDTDFGASAGVSVRILSSDSEESPQTPLLHRQRSGRLEWDYYDPSYQTAAPLHHQLPPIGSKQYWL